MSIKTIFTNALMETAKECDTQRAKIWQAYQTYNLDAAKTEVARIQAQMDVFASAKQAAVQQATDRQITELEAFWDAQARNRANDVNYQQSLVTALQIIPAAVDTAAPADLKARLEMFNDDPIAIAAIQGALVSLNKNEKTHLTTDMRNISILPTDTRQERKNTLMHLCQTVLHLLEEMKIQVKLPLNYAIENHRLYDFKIISGPPAIASTLDYIAACTDDCTVYNRSDHYARKWDFGTGDIRWDYGITGGK